MYAPVALALFLSYRILDIADLTTDGCFVLGRGGVRHADAPRDIRSWPSLPPCWRARARASSPPFCRLTLGVPSILAGIVTNTGLYTVNLMAMGWKANQSLLGGRHHFHAVCATAGIGGRLVRAAAGGFGYRTLAGGAAAGCFWEHALGLSIPGHG
ncbi:MAG: hypothetical protein ACLU38_12585 [Dysosmobacter sp.]